MKQILKYSLCLILGVIAFSSCTKNDVYDPNYVKEQYDEAFKTNVLGGADIDSEQTWNSSVMSSLNVTIQLDLGETYVLRLFTENPLYDSTATLLAQSTGKTGETVTMQFAKPMASKLLYIEAINNKNRFTVQTVDIEGTAASISLGASVTSRSNTKGISTDPVTYQKGESVFLNPSLLTGINYYDVTNIPQGELSSIDSYGDGKHYEIPAGKSVTANLGYSQQKDADCVILVKGTWRVPSDIQFSNSQLILVDNGGKIIFNGNATFDSGARFVNKGIIETATGTISIENSSTAEADCYNSGTMTLNKGGLSVAGNNSQLYNNGIMLMKYLEVRGSCTFTNFGKLTAESTTKNNYTTSGQSTAASNFNFVNGCYAKINAAGITELTLCNSSRLDCPTGIYTGGGNSNNYIVMGDHAVIKAGDWIDNGGHIYGSDNSSGSSVFQFTGTVSESSSSAFLTKGYVYFDGTFNNDYHVNAIRTGDADEWNKDVCKNHMTYFSKEKGSTITIPEGDCTGDGYNPKNNPVDPPVTVPTKYYYAFEDLGTIGDYDFNDIVLSVEYPVINGSQKDAVIKLCAAGGTLPVSVKYDSETICEEVHNAFGVSTSTMVNTGSTVKDVVTLKTLSNVGDSFNASSLDLSIVVSGDKTSTEVKANTQPGDVPQMIRVPSPWKWPKEKVNISEAYNEEGFSFGVWGSNYSSNIDWYKHPVTTRVIE